MSTQPSFTGRTRLRKTTRLVRLADRVAKATILVGGIGTIVAVLLVFVFLLYVVAPLFFPASVSPATPIELATSNAAPAEPTRASEAPPVLASDDQRTLGWSLSPRQGLEVFAMDPSLEQGRHAIPWPDGAPPTAIAVASAEGRFALGFADGALQLGKIGFAADYPSAESLESDLRSMEVGERKRKGDAVFERLSAGQIRRQAFEWELEPRLPSKNGSPIQLLDVSFRDSSAEVVTYTADGKLALHRIKAKVNRRTRKATPSVTTAEWPLNEPSVRGSEVSPPAFLFVSPLGDSIFVAWRSGLLRRYAVTANSESPQIAEETRLFPEDDVQVTAMTFLLGKGTLAVGDSQGRTRCWFLTKPPDAKTSDGAVLTMAHELSVGPAAVASLAISARRRLLAVGYENGATRLYYPTNERMLFETTAPVKGAVRSLAIAPRDDGLLVALESAASRFALSRFEFDAPHPEISFTSLFRPVWYESFAEPTHAWQSTSGGDEFEPKFGMWPLIFGTLKATFYSLLFGVPLALCAAVFTSEFLHPAWRRRVKPAIELMASLPSVVLGFIASLVLAPWVERFAAVVFTAIFAVPYAFLLGAHLWQLFSPRTRLAMGRWKFGFIVAALPCGAYFAFRLGKFLENRLFEGDAIGWLDGRVTDATGGWFVMLLPLVAMVTTFLYSRWITSWIRSRTRNWRTSRVAWGELAKFLSGSAVTLVLAWLGAKSLMALGFDPRGSRAPAGATGLALVNTYEQSNALIVGIVMGFAIIPLIYTIAEDALSSVPRSLRSASLGAGATPWQTATRIVIPTAMSGLFSAIMIGLGRAVGETMIVLMAAGGTPITEINVFNGFRTLSANLATELPEAVRDSTHFRTLFLAGLLLFGMTFVLNTFAERVRRRFRRRAVSL